MPKYLLLKQYRGGPEPHRPRRTSRPPGARRTSPSATTWSVRPPALGPPSCRKVVSLSHPWGLRGFEALSQKRRDALSRDSEALGNLLHCQALRVEGARLRPAHVGSACVEFD
jgi:hypothetical protein